MTSNNSKKREKELTTPTIQDSEQSPSNQITVHDKAQNNMVNTPNKNMTASTINNRQNMRRSAVYHNQAHTQDLVSNGNTQLQCNNESEDSDLKSHHQSQVQLKNDFQQPEPFFRDATT